MLLEISVRMWDRMYKACACELYSQQTSKHSLMWRCFVRCIYTRIYI